jgi:drug/metabolite transporter (DMT)-like permease
MNRLLIGVACGVLFGLIDVLMTIMGKHADASTTMFLQAFSSRFAIGVLAATVVLPVHPVISGAIVGLLISLPDAFGLHSYTGVLGTGLLFGALTGWAAKLWSV